MALSENYESYCYYVLTHYSNYGKLEKEGNFYHITLFSSQKYIQKLKKIPVI